MVISFNASEKDVLILALDVLRGEYERLADAAFTPSMKQEFDRLGLTASNLRIRAQAAAAVDSPELFNTTVLGLMKADQKINAIKYIREQKAIGLKDAKDLAEKMEREEQERVAKIYYDGY